MGKIHQVAITQSGREQLAAYGSDELLASRHLCLLACATQDMLITEVYERVCIQRNTRFTHKQFAEDLDQLQSAGYIKVYQ